MTNLTTEEMQRIVDGAPDDLKWLSENVHQEQLDRPSWFKKNKRDIGYTLAPYEGNPFGGNDWYSSVEILRIISFRTILAQQQEIERLRELVSDVLIDNHRHGYTTPKTLNAIQNHVSKGESDE